MTPVVIPYVVHANSRGLLLEKTLGLSAKRGRVVMHVPPTIGSPIDFGASFGLLPEQAMRVGHHLIELAFALRPDLREAVRKRVSELGTEVDDGIACATCMQPFGANDDRVWDDDDLSHHAHCPEPK